MTANSFTIATVDLTYLVMTWNNYNQYKEDQISALVAANEDLEIPEIFEYLEECDTCSVLPTIEIAPGSAAPSVGDPMIGSLMGSGIVRVPTAVVCDKWKNQSQ